MKLGNNHLDYVCGRWGMLNSVSIFSERCVFPIVSLSLLVSLSKTTVYYIITSEIPSELCRENFISSHVKITCYLHTWRDHRRYGYIINRAFESKLIWHFTGVYIINRILHTRLWIWILSSLSLVRYRVDHSKIKFISTRGHVISSISFLSICFLRGYGRVLTIKCPWTELRFVRLFFSCFRVFHWVHRKFGFRVDRTLSSAHIL